MTRFNADDSLHIWIIYESPEDFPGLFVAREWWQVGAEPYASDNIFTATTLQGVRDQIPQGLYRMPRHPEDVPHVVESWF